MEWIDLSASTGFSTRQMVEADPTGFLSRGFRYATPTEVCDLLASQVELRTCGEGVTVALPGDVLADFQALFGPTGEDPGFRTTNGWIFVADPFEPTLFWGMVSYNATTATPRTSVGVSERLIEEWLDSSSPFQGHWLVRGVPEPSAAVLTLCGVLITIVRIRLHVTASPISHAPLDT